MNEDSIKLLKECNAGCKMAIHSMEQVEEFDINREERHILDDYKKKHEELEMKSRKALQEAGEQDKEPAAMASVLSWFTTEMRMMMKNDAHQVAKLMMDGCNMGIQSVCQYRNQYTEASKEAKDLAKALVSIEEKFVKELEQFL